MYVKIIKANIVKAFMDGIKDLQVRTAVKPSHHTFNRIFGIPPSYKKSQRKLKTASLF